MDPISNTPGRPHGPRTIMGAVLSAALLGATATPVLAQDDIGGGSDGQVSVVQVSGLHLADSTSWSIEPTPFVTIGALEGEEPYLFGEVEGVLLLPGGQIVVADGQARELRVFDLQGAYIRTVGRDGDGPGELTGISGMRRMHGDSVAVFSEGANLVHIFDPSLEFVRRERARLSEQSAEPPLSSSMLEGVFANGDPFFGDYMPTCRNGDGEICSDSVRFSRTDGAGDVLARFGTFEWERLRRISTGSGPSSSMNWPLPQPLWAVGPDHVHFFDQDLRELRVFDLEGALVRRVIIGGTPPDWRRREVFPPPPPGAYGDLPPELRAGLRRSRSQLQSSPLPDPFPTFSDMLADEDGWLWLREYLPAEPDEPRMPRWYVFDPDGHLRYALASPPGMIRRWRTVNFPPEPKIYDDIVLGVVTDDLGVQRVVGYRLSKNDAR